MEIVRVEGMNRDLAPPDGWDAEKHGECSPLPVFAEVVNGDMVMTSAWKPSAEELAHLNAGGAVACVVYGTLHPPIALGVFPAAVCGGQVPLTGEDGVHPGPMPTQELVVKVDGSLLDGYVKRLVVAVQGAVDGLHVPEGMTEQRGEYWKAGARAAIRAVDRAIQAVPVDDAAGSEGKSDGEATAD